MKFNELKPFSKHIIFLRLTAMAAIVCSVIGSVSACIDSAWIRVEPVSCYGLRDGIITIDSVFGGDTPYYFAINGQYKSTRPVFDRLYAGYYTISIHPGDYDTCVYAVTLYVSEPPPLQVKIFASDTQVVSGEAVTLRAEVTPSFVELSKINWRPPWFFEDTSQLEQVVFPGETTEFTIEVRDLNDCPARDRQFVQVERAAVYVPNVFDPESLENAVFTVFAGMGIDRVVLLQVYNRGGALVFEDFDFEPNNLLRGWRGRWKNKPAPAGTYVWRAIIRHHDGALEHKTGDVTIIR